MKNFKKENIMKIWKENEECEKKFWEILNKKSDDIIEFKIIRENAIELRESYKIGRMDAVAGCQELIETYIKQCLFNHLIDVKTAYIFSDANDCYGIWEQIC